MIEAYKGSTSRSTFFSLVDSTTGLPKTGITFSDVTGSYVRTRSSRTAITVITQTVTGSYSSGGFIEVDATNEPGLYRFDVPDAAFASGVEEVVVSIKATGCKTEHKGFVLVDWNKQVASVPNAVAGAASGLAIVGSNVGSATSVTGSVGSVTAGVTVTTNNDKTGYTASTVSDKTGYSLSGTQTFNLTGNITGSLSGSVGSVTGSVGSIATGGIASTSFAADAISAASVSAAAVTKIQAGLSTYAGADTGGTTTLLARLTSTRAGLLDNLDAAVSTRSTYAGADTSGTTTLLSRLTAARTGYLDQLGGTFTTSSSSVFSTAALANAPSGGGGGSGVTLTQLQTELDTRNLTSSKMANLDETVGSRLATSGYTAPTTPPTAVQIRTEMDANSTKLAQLGGAFAGSTSVFTTAALANASGGGGGGEPQTVTQDYLGTGSLVVEDRNTGQAIVGATVKAYSASAYLANGSLASVIDETTTDSSGHWSLTLPASQYTIVFGYGGNQNTINITVH